MIYYEQPKGIRRVAAGATGKEDSRGGPIQQIRNDILYLAWKRTHDLITNAYRKSRYQNFVFMGLASLVRSNSFSMVVRIIEYERVSVFCLCPSWLHASRQCSLYAHLSIVHSFHRTFLFSLGPCSSGDDLIPR